MGLEATGTFSERTRSAKQACGFGGREVFPIRAGRVNREAMTTMFWFALGLFAGSAYLFFRHIRRRRWLLTAVAGGSVALSLTALAGFSIINWGIARAKAECATVPNLVPFLDGMTLCPGQSTILRQIRMRPPPTQGI